MTPAQSVLLESLSGRLDARAVVTDPAAIEPWETDWRGRFHGHAPALIAPASRDEVAMVVRRAAELGVPLVPQGGNTSMVGGATPPADGAALILSTRRIEGLEPVPPRART